MLNGFRWQLLALAISIVLFATVLSFRLFTSPAEIAPTATIEPTQAATITVAPTFTPLPTQAVDASSAVPEDTVTTFTEGIVGTVQRLNPLFITSQAERDITSLIFEGLVTINEFGEPVADLASDWVVSRDGYEYVVTFRSDVRWQDGTVFNADDVVFTYHLLADPDFPLREISAFWQTVEVQRLSDTLIRFRLAQPLASFPTLLTVGILPEHALQGTTAQQLVTHPFNLTPIGTGAYQLEGLRSSNGQQIEAVDLRLSPVYQNRVDAETSYTISRMRFRLFSTFEQAVDAFIADELDGLASRTMSERAPLLNLGNAEAYFQIEPLVGMLIFNWNEGDETRFFSDIRVRTALQLSLNRRNPVETALFNQAIVADSPLRPDSWAYNPTLVYPDADAVRANELFDSANIVVPEDLDLGEFRYRFSILTPDTPALVAIATNIANQWSQFNLDVTVEAVADDIYDQRLADGDFDTAIVEYVLGADPDVFAYWHADQYPDGLNYGGISDSRVSEILERGRQTVNNLARVTVYRDFQIEFIGQAIAIPLYYPLYTYAVSNDVDGVQLGFISSPEDRFRTLEDWVIGGS